MSIFNNESILAWLKYFSDNADIDLASIRILDVTGRDKNLMAAVQANPSVLVFTDGNHPEIFIICGTTAWGTARCGTTRALSPAAP